MPAVPKTRFAKAPGKIKLAMRSPAALDLPDPSLCGSPAALNEKIDAQLLYIALLMRPPIIVRQADKGRYTVIANAETVIWYRLLPLVSQLEIPMIHCIEVESVVDAGSWQAINNWLVDGWHGNLSRRRTAAVNRGVRGSDLAGVPINESVRAQLATLLKKKRS
ncbi:hypothetical protein [Hydrocarboniphaga effusa]|uniref:hypothetical protein n=1 Tax=Hydrocarboniphaga effusa TaxID=243629 RepID=UPI003BAB61A7